MTRAGARGCGLLPAVAAGAVLPTPPTEAPPDPRRAATFLLAAEVAVRGSQSLEFAGQAVLVTVFVDAGLVALVGGLAVITLAGLVVRTLARAWALGPGLRHAQGPGLAVAVAVALGVSVLGWVVGLAAQFAWSQAVGRMQAVSISDFFQAQTAIRTASSIVEWVVLAGLLAYGLLSTRARPPGEEQGVRAA